MNKKIFALFFALATFLLIFLYTWFKRDAMEWWLIHSSYYVMLTIFVLWIISISRYCQVISFDLQTFIKNYWQGILGALILTIIVFISVTPDYRVLSDETNLLSVSQSMVYDKTIYNTTMAKWYYNDFYPIIREIPIRPFLFPFVASLLHNVLGYSRNNVFILNFIILFILLSLSYCCTKKILNQTCGFASMLLIMSQPVISINATSGGFDLMSVTFLGLTLVSLFGFVSKPTSESFVLLWMTLIIFANIRYESFIYIFLILFFLLTIRLLKFDYLLEYYYVYIATPFLFLPFIWQQIIKQGYYNEQGGALFSFENILNHLLELFNAQFNFNYFFPYGNLINFLGIIFILILIWKIILNPQLLEGVKIKLFWTILIFLLIHNLIYLAHQLGQYTHPVSARFFLGFSISLALVPIIYQSITKKLNTKYIFVFSLILFSLYHPIAIKNKFYLTSTLPRKTFYVRNFLKSLNNREILIIIDRPGQYTVENYGSINFNYANANVENLLLELNNKLYQNIIVIQDVDFQTQKPIETNQLNDKFKLETILKQQYTDTNYIRISQVKF